MLYKCQCDSWSKYKIWPFGSHFMLLHISLFCSFFLPGIRGIKVAVVLKVPCLIGPCWEAGFLGDS